MRAGGAGCGARAGVRVVEKIDVNDQDNFLERCKKVLIFLINRIEWTGRKKAK